MKSSMSHCGFLSDMKFASVTSVKVLTEVLGGKVVVCCFDTFYEALDDGIAMKVRRSVTNADAAQSLHSYGNADYDAMDVKSSCSISRSIP